MDIFVSKKLPLTIHVPGYTHHSLIKKDGNCFYTAFIYAFLDQLSNKECKIDICAVKEKLKNIYIELEASFGSSLGFDDFYEMFIEEIDKRIVGFVDLDENDRSKEYISKKDFVKSTSCCESSHIVREDESKLTSGPILINNSNASDSKIYDLKEFGEKSFEDNSLDYSVMEYNNKLVENASKNSQEHYTSMIAFLRLIVSNHIKKNKERFEPIVGDVFRYTKTKVDVFYADAGEIETISLSEALGVGIKIIASENDNFSFSCGERDDVVLLFNTLHFEPLFK